MPCAGAEPVPLTVSSSHVMECERLAQRIQTADPELLRLCRSLREHAGWEPRFRVHTLKDLLSHPLLANEPVQVFAKAVTGPNTGRYPVQEPHCAWRQARKHSSHSDVS